MDDPRAWRESFLAVYERARTSGDVAELAALLADDLRLQDPQLPGGLGSKADVLRLTQELAERCARLEVRRYGPLCASEDGSVFAQRWFVDADLQVEDPGQPSAVQVETFEQFASVGGLVVAMTVFVRDFAAAVTLSEPRSARGPAAL